MTTLVLDTDPKWLEFCASHGATICTTLEAALAHLDSGNFNRVIVSSLMLDVVKELTEAGARVEVATTSPDTEEAVKAYKAGACEYWVKSFQGRL